MAHLIKILETHSFSFPSFIFKKNYIHVIVWKPRGLAPYRTPPIIAQCRSITIKKLQLIRIAGQVVFCSLLSIVIN